ncbi:NAD(+) synthase [Chloroflexota bacterium]
MQQLKEKLVSWIREQVDAAGARGVVVGISGGIDSSVAIVLGKLAFPDTTLGLIMPCYSIQKDMDHACAVANKFKIPTRIVNLDSAFDELCRSLSGNTFETEESMRAEANLKPRIRMTTLYYFASQLNYVVMGSSNRCELQMGYFTKYGDGGIDILPLGNLVKSQVCDMARHLGIPKEIIDKPPSAGLWEGQTDEQDMGLTYKDIDRYLTTGEASVEVKKRIEERIALNAHKKNVPPISPF